MFFWHVSWVFLWPSTLAVAFNFAENISHHTLRYFGAIALSYPPRVRVRAMAKLSAMFYHGESSITKGGGGTKVQ